MGLKEQLLDYIRKEGVAGYAEIEHFLERQGYDYRGDMDIVNSQNENIIF